MSEHGQRITDEKLEAAIRAFECVVSAPIAQGLVDADILALKAMYELRERRAADNEPAVRHVCGAQGFDSYLGDVCPACKPSSESDER